jgi:hypothetical protein
MRRRFLTVVLGAGLLLLAVALAARGASPVGAEPLPRHGTPKTAHVQIEGAFKADNPAEHDRVELTLTGQGDYDAPRKAMQFAAQMKMTGLAAGQPQSEQVPVEVVAVDGRVYLRDPKTQRWIWEAAPAGAATGFPLAPDDLHLFESDGLSFVRVGPEEIAGAATTHWHADLDLASLLGDDGSGGSSAASLPLTLRATYDLWIGDADSYIHRVAYALDFSAAGPDGQASTFAATATATYSNFDLPVTIAAPDGAVPAPTSPTGQGAAGALGGILPADVASSLGSLPLGALGLELPGTNGSGAAAPSPRPVVRVGPAEPTTGRPPTATPAPTKVPTAIPPTPTVAAAARAANNAAPIQPTPGAIGAIQAAPTPNGQAQAGPPLPLAIAGIGLLLALAVSLVVWGRRALAR